MRRANRGKGFRDELSLTCRMLRCWRHCFDDTGSYYGPRRPGDLVATWRGFSVLLEAKETRVARLPFARLEHHQEKSLWTQHESGGIALVAIKWIQGNRPRAFVLSVSTWRDLQRTLGRASIPLGDRDRPPELVELPRRRVRNHLVMQGEPNDLVWDFRPALNGLVRARVLDLAERCHGWEVA